MKRTLLFIMALLVSASVSFAADPTKPDLLAQGFDAEWAEDRIDDENPGSIPTYDEASKTITFHIDNSNIGWGFYGEGQADILAEYQLCIVEFEPVDFAWEFVLANWNDGSGVLVKKQVPKGASKAIINIGRPATNITIQCNTADVTLTLKAAYLCKATTFAIDFESDEIGKEYPAIAWNDDDISAVVEENPDGTGKALHIINKNWNSYPTFSVTFPQGKTLADVAMITFDLYFESVETVNGQTPNSYKGFDYFIGAPGATFEPNKATGNTGNLVAAPEDNPEKTWLAKDFIPTITDAALLELNEFDFTFGMGINEAGNYFLDNITFYLVGEGGEEPELCKFDILPSFGSSGWDSSYDEETQTITFDKDWVGRGWWLEKTDYSKYVGVVVDFEPVEGAINLIVEYNGAESTEVTVDAGETTMSVIFDETGKSSVSQIYIQSAKAGTMKLIAAYLTGECPPATTVFDFEADVIDATYPMMHAWGWPETSSATVVADPLEISGNSLKVVTANYDGCVYFDVILPEGKTVANINAVQFDAYFEEGEGDITGTIELFMAASDAPIGGGAAFSAYPVYLKTPDTSDQIQVAVAGEWFTNDITRANIKDAAYNLKGNVPDFAAINDLNQFLFGIGLSLQGGSEYYMDNITFVLGDPQSNTQTVVLERSLVYPVVGGIIVTGANEKVLVYGIDGRLVKQTLADNQFIPLEKGLYIVKVGAAAAVKVLVK